MSSYIGVKLIEAHPAKRDGVDGYKVFYPNPDGSHYESWSPKEVFERAYFALEKQDTITEYDVQRFCMSHLASNPDEKTTLVGCETRTGFMLYEASSCVDPKNFNMEIGADVCLKKIHDKVWSMLGFVLLWAKNGVKPCEYL
jgi:hypothetical protein